MKLRILIFISLISTFGFLAVGVFAQEGGVRGYTLLEPISVGITTFYGGTLSTYLEMIFAFAISIAGILAVLMIVIGGIQYMTAYGNPGRLQNAKDRIFYAILGLLLAISAWLILYTINPDLIKGGLAIPDLPRAQRAPALQETARTPIQRPRPGETPAQYYERMGVPEWQIPVGEGVPTPSPVPEAETPGFRWQ
jgi:hypothetical protein